MKKRKNIADIRIFHCPTMVGGNPQGLSAAEKSLGLKSESVSLSRSYLGYKADRIVFRSGENIVFCEFRRWIEIFRVLCLADIIHFNFGETLAPSQYFSDNAKYDAFKIWIYNNLYARWFEFIDLKIARILGKVVTVTYQGDDARQGDFCEKNYPIHFCREVDGSYYSKKSDANKRRKIDVFAKYAHFIYTVNPDLLNVLPERAKFIPYASVSLEDWDIVKKNGHNQKEIHIVHAPSHRDVKGTKYIIQAFERLKREGYEFRYTLVEGMSNQDAKKIYETADLLVDQLLAGYYGGLAVELMALGKPVICYMRESDLHFMPEDMRKDMPIINATPDTIYDVLKDYLTTHKSDLDNIGMRGRAYVEKWHDPLKIAQTMYDDALSVMKRGYGV
ncbi:glycosyltransferase family protein [Micavibrio aeruginosavorus]|uniref:Glycosyltransferase n=1 Tax=Micavibrio aeruginosavorus EPB TaxID=349215 RepID=M4VEI8_9BACT|nr:glycosyltransferase family 1 protein [Micavibrio aeruginosavorus]AGH97797.1 hypothetical protein A11S_977 [Micavibrio aeruginosavorus EPB]